MRKLELLSPARDAETGRIAILAGADAVYIGAPAFGARAAATNSIESIAELCAFAHRYRARVYVTMNTIVYEQELPQVEEMVWRLYSAGVDALIVQDMAYLMMKLPPIALHASTQCDIRTPEKAAMLAQAGFSQLVLPREFTLEEIRAAAEAAGVPIEVFVHGALCVSYSGDCQAGYAAMGRSANRGECPQICRLSFDLTDSAGNKVAPAKHYLSLRDLNRSTQLAELADAGATSFKIEGRLKDARYVANVTAAYSRALDALIAESDGKYCRASAGRSECSFTPDLNATFNRGYTSYFLKGARPDLRMASLDTPKWTGSEVGKVRRTGLRGGAFEASLTRELANGDGLGFFDGDGTFHGFRLNKVEGSVLYPATALTALKPGMTLLRNSDKTFLARLDAPDAGCRRTITVDFRLEAVDDTHIALSAGDERGCSATVNIECPAQEARSPQEEARQRTMSKLGDTIYTAGTLDDKLGSRFVPLSVLAEGRRSLIAALDTVAEATYSYDRRKPMALAEDAFVALAPLTYHDNIANTKAKEFYASHGAVVKEKALEASRMPEGDVTVMTTRYCIRRELGACLREKNARKLPTPLYLRNPSGTYRLDFDCARCGMKVVRTKS